MAATTSQGAVDQLAADLGNTSLNGGDAKPSAINTNVTASSSKGGPKTPNTPGGNGAPRTSKTDGFRGTTRDNVRDKCMELIYDALASDSPARTSNLLVGAYFD